MLKVSMMIEVIKRYISLIGNIKNTHRYAEREANMQDNNLQIRLIDSVVYSKEPKEFLEKAKLYQECMMKFNCAIKEIVTKVEILNE